MANPQHHRHHSLALDHSTALHHYHCVLYDIPFEVPVSGIAQHVVPKKESDTVRRLAEAGCRVVPHQLHIYKEPLDSKFGYVSFFVHQVPSSTTDADEVHRLVMTWIDLDLATQLSSVDCKVLLAQPPECHSSEPFLEAFRQQCPLLDPTLSPDTKKLETYVLSRVRFGEQRSNASINELNEAHCRGAKESSRSATDAPAGAASCSEDGLIGTEGETDCCAHACCRTVHEHVWKCVGSFNVATLTPKELVWLKKQLSTFPPLLITNSDMNSTHCDETKLIKFFEDGLAPLFTVRESGETNAPAVAAAAA